MKTHQEIRDAIQLFQVPVNAKYEWMTALDIMHAMNERIDNLQHGLKVAHDYIQTLEDRVSNL